MSQPNKQEMEQLRSLKRQLERLSETTDSLYRRMGINGRHQKYVDGARNLSTQLSELARKVEKVIVVE